MIDPGSMAKEAGFKWSVALTSKPTSSPIQRPALCGVSFARSFRSFILVCVGAKVAHELSNCGPYPMGLDMAVDSAILLKEEYIQISFIKYG